VQKIPDYPEFTPLGLTHKSEVEGALSKMDRSISEMTFSNLFLFGEAHEYRVSKKEGLLLITGKGYDGERYALPPWGEGDVEAASNLLLDHLEKSNKSTAPPRLFPVSREMVERHFSPERWGADADRDQADYVYLREELATLPGKSFHKKRNRLAKFLRENVGDYEFSELEEEHIKGCAAIANGWCEVRCSIERPSSYLETAAAVSALENREALGLSGGVILLKGEVAAYTLGEALNEETFLLHFEKTRPGEEGLAQLINRDFALHCLKGYTYINREQDLGDPGLRQAKESYRPHHLAEKFIVTRR